MKPRQLGSRWDGSRRERFYPLMRSLYRAALHRFPNPVGSATMTAVVEQKKTRVVVGMSGGVDSSAAAALLVDQGYDVVGITLKLWPQDCVNRAEDKCCGPQAVTDARAVSHKLDIPYYLVDEAEE